MKLSSMALIIVLCCVALGSTMAGASEIKPSDITGKPDVFCEVVKAPNPLLVGSWGAVHPRALKTLGDTSPEPVEYWLGKSGDQYALYFHRLKTAENRIYQGWRKWTINGDEIRSDTGVRIFVKDGEVYYGWKDDKPTKMTRIEIK